MVELSEDNFIVQPVTIMAPHNRFQFVSLPSSDA